jgi:hypothetical protein
MLAEYFDCLRCSAVTRVTTCPPRCTVCGSGTGVLAKTPEGAVRQRGVKTMPPERADSRNLLEALKQQSRLPSRSGEQPPADQAKRA